MLEGTKVKISCPLHLKEENKLQVSVTYYHAAISPYLLVCSVFHTLMVQSKDPEIVLSPSLVTTTDVTASS